MPPDITRASFNGKTVPDDLVDFIASAIISGSPFADSLTRRPSRGNLAIPTVTAVEGQSWVPEGGDIPDVSLDTDSELVVVKKLAGIFGITDEAVEDTTFPVATEVQRLARGAFSRDLDLGLLTGDGSNNTPTGVLGRTEQTSGPSLSEAIGAALAQMAEIGGQPDHVAISPSAAVAEANRTDSTGRPLYPGGVLPNLNGLTVVQVPGLAQPLVYDSRTTYLVVARDFRVTVDNSYYFRQEKTAFRISGRFGVGIPTPDLSVRKVAVAAA